jgi:hypothetical protein
MEAGENRMRFLPGRHMRLFMKDVSWFSCDAQDLSEVADRYEP